MPLGGIEDSFCETGFLKMAEFEGNIVFLFLVTGEVVHIYHKEIYNMSILNGADYQEVWNY